MAGTISTICKADFEHVNGGCLACIGQRQCSSLNMAPKMPIRGHFTDAAGDTSPDMLPKSANANLTKWFLPSFVNPNPSHRVIKCFNHGVGNAYAATFHLTSADRNSRRHFPIDHSISI